ncbi:DNA-binding response regulator, OmpR family, contains REC and winged-helix (wHTH) domain [Mariprofundus ferrinatatus]|uniref:DNA-binding response regulator, OmpR family, contains REC and winged-helix (WHTH) domain n=1 Tax=Mariprofundus ferrinatatus TaxID=1921087 RepID=A0A2K8LD24_9PROT|nr:response regulator transcription factor [Mariprofundus ferrinatatus]ATX82186.1 DNA-binding response regulator, OmpR family, contains REC and winged-helix (wHTH) domain [Mariprofundus ferrinatatus]
MRLLLAEDDAALSTTVADFLRSHGYAVDLAEDGTEAAFLGSSEPYDVIVLDLGLPGISGLQVLQQWRVSGIKTPVLILTARGAWHEKVDGFRAGADDYLTKPFHSEELLVRLQALVRRAHGHAGGELQAGPLKLDEGRQSVSIHCADGRQEIELSGVEFRLLKYMMLQPGKILSASQIIEHVYDYNDEKESNVIEVYISRLRKRLGKSAILTKRGQGYVFNPDGICVH